LAAHAKEAVGDMVVVLAQMRRDATTAKRRSGEKYGTSDDDDKMDEVMRDCPL
jgi:hypothetical protein